MLFRSHVVTGQSRHRRGFSRTEEATNHYVNGFHQNRTLWKVFTRQAVFPPIEGQGLRVDSIRGQEICRCGLLFEEGRDAVGSTCTALHAELQPGWRVS